ncbi:nuclear pore complex protein NUP1-like [Vigna umbellata]|uniref:nuclear pore complex protein NUP1-like n=1 Tax=Vigna umbellata TaxID=87088 RepID=UPI001F5FCFD2|nr:nuclear pore complex protein NUP1-like [Vigna umbellata]
MATEEKEKGYEGGAGAGGKFRKRPFRGRTQTTPYDRPPTSLRNPNTNSSNNNGWFSKLLDPTQRLITHSAHSLFSSLFRKRLPPPPPPPPPETEQEVKNSSQEEAVFVASNSSGLQEIPVGVSDTQINCSDEGGLTELEKLLKQKTFSRSEIDHLTALMRSRTVDAPVREEEKGTGVVPSEPVVQSGQKECPKTLTIENGIENTVVVTPRVISSFPIEDVASPAELAKSYMGSRYSKVSSSVLGVQTSALWEDPTLVNREKFSLKSPIMTIVPRTTKYAAVHENGFMTSRSRGRSAIYNMARTPYARIYPTSRLKGGDHAVEDEPSFSSQSAFNHDVLSGSKTGAVKRRSSVLDNDIGSVGPVRRTRQKSNLLYSKGSSSLISGSSLSVDRNQMVVNASQQGSSMQKPILLDEVKHSHMKLSKENVDGTIPSLSSPPLPSKSSEMASKIMQQLDKLVSPKEKSSESRLTIVNDNPPTKLSPSMLRGQALQSMETVDSSKLLNNMHGNNLDGPFGNLSGSAQNQKLNSQRDKVENGPLKLVAPTDGLLPLITTEDATKTSNKVLSTAKSGDSFMIKSVSDLPRKKRAFHMSAHEDFLDLDDDDYPNGAVSSFSLLEKEMTSSTAVTGETNSSHEATEQENPSAMSKTSTIDGNAHIGTAYKSKVGEKVDVSIFSTSSNLDPTYKPVTATPNGSVVKPPLFISENKVVSSREFTAPSAPPKEITKSGPTFGLEKVVSSKDRAADAPMVEFGSNKNVNKVLPVPFTASSSIGAEPSFPKFSASVSNLGSSISTNTVAGTTDSMPKVRESDNGNAESTNDTESSVKASELASSSAASTSFLTSSKSIFNFGHNSNQNNGSLASPSFSSFPPPVSGNFTSPNIFSSLPAVQSSAINMADSNGSSMASMTTGKMASSNSSSSTPVVASSYPTTSVFKFGSSPVPSTSLPLSSSGLEPLETKRSQDAGAGSLSCTAFGSSSAGIGNFGFISSATKTVNSLSRSVVGASSGSVHSAQASTTIGLEACTQTQSVPFGSSASSPSYGLTGNTTFSLSSFSSPSSSPSFSFGSSLFSSSPAINVMNSGTTFGFCTSASSSAVNSLSSNTSTSSTSFGSSWQPSKSPFGSTFNSSSGLSLGTSTASVSSPTMFLSTSSASTPQFSFTSAAASISTQHAFGSPTPAFAFGSAPVNNQKMSMEDGMAEDTVQATTPATSVFRQQPGPLQSNFVFGASTPSAASSFQFGTQQNIALQNPSFQTSGSVGGSFSLGTGGGDKSGRRIVKAKHKQRKK